MHLCFVHHIQPPVEVEPPQIEFYSAILQRATEEIRINYDKCGNIAQISGKVMNLNPKKNGHGHNNTNLLCADCWAVCFYLPHLLEGEDEVGITFIRIRRAPLLYWWMQLLMTRAILK